MPDKQNQPGGESDQTIPHSNQEPLIHRALRAAEEELAEVQAQRTRDLALVGETAAVVRIKVVAPTTNTARAALTQIQQRLDAGYSDGSGIIPGKPVFSHYTLQVNGKLVNDGPGEITHLALVSIDDEIVAMPATSAEHALQLLRKRAEAWEFEGMETVDMASATLEQLSGYIAEDSDPGTNWVAIAEVWLSWPVGSSEAYASAASSRPDETQGGTQPLIRLVVEANTMEEFRENLEYARHQIMQGERQGAGSDGLGNRFEFVNQLGPVRPEQF